MNLRGTHVPRTPGENELEYEKIKFHRKIVKNAEENDWSSQDYVFEAICCHNVVNLCK